VLELLMDEGDGEGVIECRVAARSPAQWDSLEKLQAYRNTAEFKEPRATVGDKLAKYRSFAVEGM
jgi:hypothetical protein